eukprot:2051462-Amphidinium_carterae.1
MDTDPFPHRVSKSALKTKESLWKSILAQSLLIISCDRISHSSVAVEQLLIASCAGERAAKSMAP